MHKKLFMFALGSLMSLSSFVLAMEDCLGTTRETPIEASVKPGISKKKVTFALLVGSTISTLVWNLAENYLPDSTFEVAYKLPLGIGDTLKTAGKQKTAIIIALAPIMTLATYLLRSGSTAKFKAE